MGQSAPGFTQRLRAVAAGLRALDDARGPTGVEDSEDNDP